MVEQEGERPIFSIGPQLSKTPDCFVTALRDLVAPGGDDLPVQSSAPIMDCRAGAAAVAAVVVEPGGNFAIDSADVLHAPAIVDNPKSSIGISSLRHRLLFFSVLKSRPCDQVIPPFAPKVTDNQMLCISLLQVAGYDGDSKVVYLRDDSAQGHSLEPMLLSSTLFTAGDLASLRLWRRKDEVAYAFGWTVPSKLHRALNMAVERLLQSHSKGAVFDIAAEPHGENRDALHQGLHLLQQHNCALQQSDACVGSGEFWTLTDHGRSKLQYTFPVHSARFFLQARSGMDALMDLGTYELACMLQQRNWTCHVFDSRLARDHRKDITRLKRRSRGDSQVPAGSDAGLELDPKIVPQDFKQGGPLIWWVRATSTCLRVQYMRCLLLVSSAAEGTDLATQSLPHFMPERFYTCVMSGTPYTRNRRNKFTIEDADAGATGLAQAKPKARPGRKRRKDPRGRGFARRQRRRRGDGSGEADMVAADEEAELCLASHCPAPEESDEVAEGSSASSGSRARSSDGDEDMAIALAARSQGAGEYGDDVGESPAAAADSDTSRTSSSSSSSSESRPSGSSGPSDGSSSDSSGAPAPPPPAPAPASPQPVAPAPRGPGRLAETTMHWFGFKMCEIKQHGAACGWEMTCKHHAPEGKRRCTRSLRWDAHGGADLTERKLKWWACLGAGLRSRAEHMAAPRMPEAGEASLPSIADIDAEAADLFPSEL